MLFNWTKHWKVPPPTATYNWVFKTNLSTQNAPHIHKIDCMNHTQCNRCCCCVSPNRILLRMLILWVIGKNCIGQNKKHLLLVILRFHFISFSIFSLSMRWMRGKCTGTVDVIRTATCLSMCMFWLVYA